MKNHVLSIIAIALITFVACQQPAEVEKSESPDYDVYNKNVEVLRSFLKAHMDEDIDAQRAILSDTVKWSPASFNGNKWLGKEDYLKALKSYHDGFENIKYVEGIILPDTLGNGFFAGSVFPKTVASSAPNVLRSYGTWTGKHTESGKEIGVKWYAVSAINDAGKIVMQTEYFDVNGIAAQLAEE